MSLTKEDLQLIKDIVQESESRLRKEISQFRLDMRDELSSVRAELEYIKRKVEESRAGLKLEEENRTEDTDLAFSEITKYLDRIKKLEARVAKLEKTAA
jgi:hypothetical protein